MYVGLMIRLSSRRVNETIIFCYTVLEKPVFMQNFRFIVHPVYVRYGLHYNVLLEPIIIGYTRSERVNGKLYAYALARIKICLHPKFQDQNYYRY